MTQPAKSYPFAPFQMKAPIAAWYCGMALTTFHNAVKAGELPKGKKRTGGMYWLRTELESAMLESEARKVVDFSQRI